MFSKITPALKGLITGLLMIGATLGLHYTKADGNSYFQYAPYVIYALGITWTLVAYRKTPAFTGKFKDLFSQAFRCFIVVTLVMVTFYGLFLSQHPEFKEENAKAYREYLVKEKNKTPAEIDQEVATSKEQFITRFISGSIFGYLLVGAVVSVGISALLMRRNQ